MYNKLTILMVAVSMGIFFTGCDFSIPTDREYTADDAVQITTEPTTQATTEYYTTTTTQATTTTKATTTAPQTTTTAVKTQLSESDLKASATKLGTVAAWEYHDYDNNGTKEAYFVITRDYDDTYTVIDGIYYINADGKMDCLLSSGTELADCILYDGEYANEKYVETNDDRGYFTMEGSTGGSGSWTYIYGVENNKSYELDLSGNIECFHKDGNDFSGYTLGDDLEIAVEYDSSSHQFVTGSASSSDSSFTISIDPSYFHIYDTSNWGDGSEITTGLYQTSIIYLKNVSVNNGTFVDDIRYEETNDYPVDHITLENVTPGEVSITADAAYFSSYDSPSDFATYCDEPATLKVDITVDDNGNITSGTAKDVRMDSSHKCGKNAYWSYDSDNRTLTIFGTGQVTDAGWEAEAPIDEDGIWNVQTVIIEHGITELHRSYQTNFAPFNSLWLPNTLTYIDDLYFAFLGDCCMADRYLSSVTIPKSVTHIGEGAFNTQHCGDGSAINMTDNFTIYGQSGSTAETYAKENGIKFSSIG